MTISDARDKIEAARICFDKIAMPGSGVLAIGEVLRWAERMTDPTPADEEWGRQVGLVDGKLMWSRRFGWVSIVDILGKWMTRGQMVYWRWRLTSEGLKCSDNGGASWGDALDQSNIPDEATEVIPSGKVAGVVYPWMSLGDFVRRMLELERSHASTTQGVEDRLKMLEAWRADFDERIGKLEKRHDHVEFQNTREIVRHLASRAEKIEAQLHAMSERLQVSSPQAGSLDLYFNLGTTPPEEIVETLADLNRLYKSNGGDGDLAIDKIGIVRPAGRGNVSDSLPSQLGEHAKSSIGNECINFAVDQFNRCCEYLGVKASPHEPCPTLQEAICNVEAERDAMKADDQALLDELAAVKAERDELRARVNDYDRCCEYVGGTPQGETLLDQIKGLTDDLTAVTSENLELRARVEALERKDAVPDDPYPRTYRTQCDCGSGWVYRTFTKPGEAVRSYDPAYNGGDPWSHLTWSEGEMAEIGAVRCEDPREVK